jgi:hypothetical protein
MSLDLVVNRIHSSASLACGRDAFHGVPLLAFVTFFTENMRDAVERVPTLTIPRTPQKA